MCGGMFKASWIFSFLVVVTLSGAYFSFDDCSTECRREAFSCLITQITKTEFSKLCMKSQPDCEQQASDDSACVNLNAPTIGGNLIWRTFNDNKPKPPTPDLNVSYSRIWMILSIVLGLILLKMMFIRAIAILRRYNYNQIINQDPNNPYQDTTENISHQ